MHCTHYHQKIIDIMGKVSNNKGGWYIYYRCHYGKDELKPQSSNTIKNERITHTINQNKLVNTCYYRH